MHKFKYEPIQNPQQSTSEMRNSSPTTSKAEQNHPIPLDQLMLHLSRYKQLKQLPLNPISEPKDQLWRDSPCTIRCTNRNVSMDRIARFTVGSIYHKDNINEQKKIFTQSQKPELMLKNFRRQVEQASYSRNKYNRKSSQISADRSKMHSKTGRTTPSIQSKVYHIPQKTELKFDRNGARSTYVGDYDVKKIIDRFRSTKTNFTSSRRMDLALPLNFNPGPGNYFAKSQEFIGCQTFRTRKSQRNSINLHQKTQRLQTLEKTRQQSSHQISK